MEITNGKFEGIIHIASIEGLFMMVATDQRGSLKKMINPKDPGSVTPEQMKEVKRDLIKYLAGRGTQNTASGVLVDPQFSYEREFLKSCEIKSYVGMLMGIESSGYGGQGEYAPKVSIFDGLDAEGAVEKIKKRGGAAVKMLVYYRKNGPTHEHQEEMIRKVGEACKKFDIAFLLEPVAHPIEGEPHPKKEPEKFAKLKPDIVIETAEELTREEYGIDVLKSEFPLNLKYAKSLKQDPDVACRRLDTASRTPWVVLSAGVDYPEFKENVKYAARNGASGFLAGRAIWKEGVINKNLEQFLKTTGIERLNELSSIVREHGTPWYKKYAERIEDVEVIRGE